MNNGKTVITVETKLTNEDVDFLTELVAQEIQKAIQQLIVQIRQTFVELAIRQLEFFEVAISRDLDAVPNSNGQAHDAG
jgi:hypothetical protein